MTASGAERHANADLMRSLRYGIRDDSVDSDRREQQGNTRERTQQPHHRPLGSESLGNGFFHREHFSHRLSRIDFADRCSYRRRERGNVTSSPYNKMKKKAAGQV